MTLTEAINNVNEASRQLTQSEGGLTAALSSLESAQTIADQAKMVNAQEVNDFNAALDDLIAAAEAAKQPPAMRGMAGKRRGG